MQKNSISLKKALHGLEHLYSPNGTFKFETFIPALTASIPRANWIAYKLDLWVEALKESGLSITHHKYSMGNLKGVTNNSAGNYYMFSVESGRDWIVYGDWRHYGRMIIGVEIQGSINISKLTSDMANSIIKNAKDNLSCQFQELFEPPFDPSKPKFMSKCKDTLIFDPHKNEQARKIYSEVRNTQKDKVEFCVRECILEAGAECFYVGDGRYFEFKWNNIVDDSDRNKLCNSINKALKDKFGLLISTKLGVY